jgi:hypothetical protein
MVSHYDYIYRPLASEEILLFIQTWRNLAKQNGLKDSFCGAGN